MDGCANAEGTAGLVARRGRIHLARWGAALGRRYVKRLTTEAPVGGTVRGGPLRRRRTGHSGGTLSEGRATVCMFTIHPADDVRVLHREAASLIELGLSVTLIANTPRDPGEPLLRHPDLALEVVEVPLRPLKDRLLGVLALSRRAMRVRAEAYHLHDPDLLPVGILLRLLRRRRVVYDVHEFYAMVWSAAFPAPVRKYARVLISVLEAAIARAIGSVCAVHPVMVERFRRVGCEVTLVRNLPSVEVFPPVPVSLCGWKNRDIDVVHIGGLSPDKGSELLISIAERFLQEQVSLRFVLVERFYLEAQRRAFFDRLAGSPARDLMEFVPNASIGELRALLSRCKVGLSPVLEGGQAAVTEHTKLFEYLACGVVPIASDLAGARGVLSAHDLGVLVAPGDVPAFTTAVLESSRNTESSVRMAQRGSQVYAESLNWERSCYPELRELYSELDQRAD